jgi:sugar phosphate isomerase/epimerase
MQVTRRRFTRVSLGAAAAVITGGAAPRINSTVHGVILGVQSYSFRTLPVDKAIEARASIGLGECELYQGHIEPRGVPREELRKWRLSVSLDEFKNLGKKFRDAGIDLYAYNYSFRNDFTDEEIDRGFQMAKALGAKVLTASATVDVAERVDRYAQKYRMRVGMHNHSNLKPNEFASPESFAAAQKGRSKYIAINLDIGHFTAANFDAVQFLSEHAADIVTLHIKDRKKNQGPNLPFGQGDTPIKEVLHLLRDRKLKIPANIEYEYKGEDAVAEVRKCFEYCKAALA